MKLDLAPNTKVAVLDELWMLVAVLLQEHVQHAHANTRQGDHEGEDLPCFGCEESQSVFNL